MDPLKEELTPLVGELPIFIASRWEKTPIGMEALGDWLGWYRVGNRVGILPNMDSVNMSLSKLQEILKDREAWQAASMGLQRVEHDWATEE